MGDLNVANRTIWTGNNLDILRGMNAACVNLFYLDPPFNSNRTYEAPVGSAAAGAAFKDSWTLSDLDVAWMGLIADQHPALYAVIPRRRARAQQGHAIRSVHDGRAVVGDAPCAETDGSGPF